MCICKSISVWALGVAFFWSASADAQLFGDVSLNPNKRIQAQEEGLNISGAERFLRGNRSAGDFVGAAAANAARFVGAAAAAAGPTVTASAVTGLTEETAPQVNVVRRRRATGVYDERLSIDFEYSRPVPNSSRRGSFPGGSENVSVMHQLLGKRGFQLTRSVDGTTARLEGTAQSPEQRRLAELIVLFEPGISVVENELQVAPAVPE